MARLVFRLGLVALLLITSLAVLATDVAASPAIVWHAAFFNNVNLAGPPVLERTDSAIDFTWGDASPGPGVNSEQFSARWTTLTYFDAGTYTFRATVDDGVRVWVDEQILIDQWRDQAETTFTATKTLTAGYHSVRVEYYDNMHVAICRVSWQMGVDWPPITDWRGEYYNNMSLSGPPAVVRNDAVIGFDWGFGSPAWGVNADYFSVRWTRTAYFPNTGNYTFSATVDDGVRVWVDGALIIDRWYPQSRTTHTGVAYLTAGSHHQVRVEYFEQAGLAVCIVNWSGGVAPAYEIIVDELDPGFTWGGPSGSWYGSRAAGYRGHLYWTWNTQSTVRHWAKWQPSGITAGNWEVYAFIASRYFGAKSARYSIYHAGTRHDRIVNQNIYYNVWVSLGTYYFTGAGGEYVYLTSATGEVTGTRYLGFDAVKFVRRDAAPPSPPPPAPPGPPPPPYPPPAPPPACSITPVLGFGRVWNTYSGVRSKLGCPTELEKGVYSAEEYFQGGYMFWRQDINYIYVLYNNGTWQGFPDTWTPAEPEWDPSIVPPWGYYQPKRGFGKVWRNNPAVRSGLGWATTEERGFTGSAQQFNGGLMLWSHTRGILVLYNDGRWERYD